jgi:hypothetical protein
MMLLFYWICPSRRFKAQASFCQADAEAVADKLHAASGSYHKIKCSMYTGFESRTSMSDGAPVKHSSVGIS